MWLATLGPCSPDELRPRDVRINVHSKLARLANIRNCRDEVRRTSTICSGSAKRSAELRQVEVSHTSERG